LRIAVSGGRSAEGQLVAYCILSTLFYIRSLYL
jgi:hypothetical protein